MNRIYRCMILFLEVLAYRLSETPPPVHTSAHISYYSSHEEADREVA